MPEDRDLHPSDLPVHFRMDSPVPAVNSADALPRRVASALGCVLLSIISLSTAQALDVHFDFSGALQGWQNVGGSLSFTSQTSSQEGRIPADAAGSPTGTPEGAYVAYSPFLGRDGPATTMVLSSPEFRLVPGSSIEFSLLGGRGSALSPGASFGSLPPETTDTGFQGVALRRVRDGAYLTAARRSTNSQQFWQSINLDAAVLDPIVATSNPDDRFVLDLIDTRHGDWGWVALDRVVLTVPTGAEGTAVTYSFTDSLEGWQNASSGGRFLPQNASQEGRILADAEGNATGTPEGYYVATENFLGRDGPHLSLVLRSPDFRLDANSQISFSLLGGTGSNPSPGEDAASLPTESKLGDGFLGLALRRIRDGRYFLPARRQFVSNQTWEHFVFDSATIVNDVLVDAIADDSYTLDLIDTEHGSWGWVGIDEVSLKVADSPAGDPFAIVALDVAGSGESVSVTWNSIIGQRYLGAYSGDLRTWLPLGEAWAQGAVTRADFIIPSETGPPSSLFLRIEEMMTPADM